MVANPRKERRRRAGIVDLIRHFDPLTLTGIVLSVALAVALDLTGAASGAESLLAGLVGTTMTLVLDASARAERRFELRGLVRGTSWLSGTLTSMAQTAQDIVARYPGAEVEAEAQQSLERLSRSWTSYAAAESCERGPTSNTSSQRPAGAGIGSRP